MIKYLLIAILYTLTLAGLSAKIQNLSTQLPVIVNYSLTAKGGDIISLQGSFEETASLYFDPGNGDAIQLSPETQMQGHIAVRIPQNQAINLFKIWVSDANGQSNPVYINKPWGMHFDTPEIAALDSFRIFGRNLFFKEINPLVRFVSKGGTSFSAEVVTSQSDAYVLKVVSPKGIVPGEEYAIYVNNGFTDAHAETQTEEILKGRKKGTDYWNLGVSWAADFDFYTNVYNVKTDARLSIHAMGDENNNDRDAIQEAVDKAAQDGGGVVYLPTGTYKLFFSKDNGINMKSRVVLSGDGRDNTIVTYGHGPALKNAGYGITWEDNGTTAGLADLTIRNVNESGNWVNTMVGSKGSQVFMQRITYDINTSDWIWWTEMNKMVVKNCIFNQGIDAGTGYHGPVQFTAASYFIISNNTFNYAVWGINLPLAQDGVFENNTVYRDGAARYPIDVTNHVLIIDFAHDVSVMNNTFKVLNGPAQDKNDGETIIAEAGGAGRRDEDVGTVTGSSAMTLEDNSKDWTNFFKYKPVVAIVSGSAKGQWRYVTSNTQNSLSIDEAWDVLPEAGSHYTTFNWGSYNLFFRNNTLENNRRGFTFYLNPTHDVAIVGNNLINSGSIDFTPIQHITEGAPLELLPYFNNQIIGNNVTDSNGQNGVFIGVHPIQHADPHTFGVSVIGLEVRDNILTAHVPNVPAVVDNSYPEGFLNYVEYHAATSNYQDDQMPAIIGSIFQGNTAINCDNAFYLNTASYGTVICETKLVNVSNFLHNDVLPGNSHASKYTAVCTDIVTETEIPSILTKQDYVVYPNPSPGLFSLIHDAEQSGNMKLEVKDILGNTLHTIYTDISEGKNTISISVPEQIKSGVYLLSVSLDNEKKELKMVIVK